MNLLDKRIELEVMKTYLASDQSTIHNTEEENDFKKRQTQFNKKIPDLKVWSHINNGVEKKQWEQAEALHLEKLDKYRFQEKYVQLIEEDEDDVEGEKIISDIKNLNHERFFNMYVMDGDEDHDEKLAKERFKGQSDLAASMKNGVKISNKEIEKTIHRDRFKA